MTRRPTPTTRHVRRRAALAASLAAVGTLALGSVAARADDESPAPGGESDAGAASTDTGVAADAARARLAAFTDETGSFRARFEQTLYDERSEPLQSSRGTVVLKRPGRFVWEYEEGPGSIGQTIVADGERVWLYDRELAQVTVSDIDERVGGTPLALLMGRAPLEETYAITALGEAEGIEWLELVPEAGGGDFEALFVGLDGTGLAALELRDAFGQATQIRFEDFEANVELDDALFAFEVPEGVDVIGLDEGG